MVEDELLNVASGRSPQDYKFYGVCVSQCPQELAVVCNDVGDALGQAQSAMRDCFTPNSAAYNGNTCQGVRSDCWITPATTQSLLFRCVPVYKFDAARKSRCVYPESVSDPNSQDCVIREDSGNSTVRRPARESLIVKQLNSAMQLWGRYFSDLSRAWWVIALCAVVVGMILGFVWLVFLKFCTGIMVWTTLAAVFAMCVALTVFLYVEAGILTNDKLPSFAQVREDSTTDKSSSSSTSSSTFNQAAAEFDQDSANTTAYKYAAYVMSVLTLVVLILIISMRRTIGTAIEVLKLGTDAMRALPQIVFYPLSTVVALFALLCWCLLAAASMMSAGRKSTKDLTAELHDLGQQSSLGNYSLGNYTLSFFDEATEFRYLQMYNLFGLLWSIQWILGIGVCSIAGAVAGWYFSQNPANLPEDQLSVYKQPKHPLLASTWRVVRYHLGSIAFGSLLIAIIQAIRIALAYLDRRTRDMQKKNCLLRFAMKCVQCCMWCMQKIVEVVCREAYLYIALKGESFCSAGWSALSLIRRYFKLLAVINLLSEVLMFLGKCTIATLCALIAMAIVRNAGAFQAGEEDAINAPWLIGLFTWIFAYAVAASFFNVFDITVDTVLLCYITDMDESKAQGLDPVPRHRPSNELEKLAKKAKKNLARGGSGESSGSSPRDGAEAGAVGAQAVNPVRVADSEDKVL